MKPPLTALTHLDETLAPVRDAIPSPPPGGWVNAVRRALGMSERDLAARLGVSQPSVHAMEASEAAGGVRLDTLRRAADALDCDLVYALVPRSSLEATVTGQARRIAREELSRVETTMSLEAQDVRASEDDVARRAREILESGGLWRT